MSLFSSENIAKFYSLFWQFSNIIKISSFDCINNASNAAYFLDAFTQTHKHIHRQTHTHTYIHTHTHTLHRSNTNQQQTQQTSQYRALDEENQQGERVKDEDEEDEKNENNNNEMTSLYGEKNVAQYQSDGLLHYENDVWQAPKKAPFYYTKFFNSVIYNT